MSLGTIRLNLYKTYAEDVRIPLERDSNLNIFDKRFILFFVSFLILSSILAYSVLAAHTVVVNVNNTIGNRIVQTSTSGVILGINITNQPGSANTITFVNITNSTGFQVTAVNATGNGTDACTINLRAVNCTGAGFGITAGSSIIINLTVTTPSSSGVGNWTVETNDSAGATTGNVNFVYVAAIDAGDIAFDVGDELSNVTVGATVTAVNGSNEDLNFTAGNDAKTDADDGLTIYTLGVDFQNGVGFSTDNFNYTISIAGFMNQSTQTNVSYSKSSINRVKPTGLLYGIKITVADELGNAINDPVINITDQPITPANTMAGGGVSRANASVGNIFYYAMPVRFSNVSINITRSGFLNNLSFTDFADLNVTSTFNVNASLQQVGNSTYRMVFVLRVNVTDELGEGNVFRTGTTIQLNSTAATANQTSGNLYYYSIPWSAVNVTGVHGGYVNDNETGGAGGPSGIPLNKTRQANVTVQLPFRLRVAIRDELGTNLFGFGISINDTSTNSTPNITSSSNYYYNISSSAVALTVSRDGYINSTNNTAMSLNDSAQAFARAEMNFTIRVTDICNELGRQGDCFTIDGTIADIDANALAQTNVTYSGGDAYINVSNRVPSTEIILNASKDGYVNRSVAVRVNQTNQTRVVFNGTDAGGVATNRTDGLNFTVRVYAVYNELGTRNFTINATDRLGQQPGGSVEAGIDAVSQLNNSIYFGPWAYVNATGTGVMQITAYLGNQSFVNNTVVVTPNATRQTVLIFNLTNQIGADVVTNGLRYITAVTVQDELSSARFFTASNNTVNVALNDSVRTPDATDSNVFYFANQTGALPGGLNLTNVSRAGFINTTEAERPFNATNQSTFTASLNFNFKIAVLDELANTFNAAAVNISLNNSGNAPNSTSGVYAYYAVPAGASVLDSGFAYANVSKRGWIDNSTNTSGAGGTVIEITPINSSLQALANVSLAYTVRVDTMCDELNATCFTINGVTDTDGAGGAAASGIITNYSAGLGGRAFIAAPNGTNVSITAFARGYVNASTWFIPDVTSRNVTVAFNTTPNSTTTVNTSALLFTVRVISMCTETNSTCLNINGSINLPSYGGVELAGNTSRYRSAIGYIPVPRSSAVTITAFGPGYVNASNTSVTPTSGTAQVSVTFNATTTALKYSLVVNVTDEFNQTTNMGTGVRMTQNSTVSREDKDFFRNASTSTIYYLNATNSSLQGAVNLTVSRDGYINVTRNNTYVSSASQNTSIRIELPFSVLVRIRDNQGTSFTGATVQAVDDGSNTYTVNDGNGTVTILYNSTGVVTNGSAIQGDNATTNDGDIYWALNQSNVTNNVKFVVTPNRNGYNTWDISGRVLSFEGQRVITSGNVRDQSLPAAATSVSDPVTGKQVNISWTASTSNDVDYYRVYRNNTPLGSSKTTSFTDNPTLGDATAPGAPSGVAAVFQDDQVNISWTAPSNFIYVYNVTTVDTGGNLASTNGTSDGASVSPVAYYRVYRNNTLLGTSSTTGFTDTPTTGIYIYNVTTVSDAAILSSANGTATAVTVGTVGAPAAATAVTALISGKQVQVTWTKSTSSDTSYYMVYRNGTLLGTSSNISFVDSPTLGDNSTPGAPSSVAAVFQDDQVNISWTAPASFIFVYNVTSVDSQGLLASSNGTSGSVSLSTVSHYRVYKNNTLLGTSSTTSFTDTPAAGIYIYNVTTVSDAAILSSANGTATAVTVGTVGAPAAATAVTALISGKQVQVTWTKSTSSDTSYYMVYRNGTLLGTSSNISFVDSPTLGDNSTPGAPSGVGATVLASASQVNISWTAPASFIFVYNVTSVDSQGLLASSNGTSGSVSLSTVSHYRVYRNVTLIGTSSTTGFTDTPPSGIYIYNVTTVSDAAILSSANGTSSATDTRDTTAPNAPTTLTATIAGKQVQLSWTASSSSDVSYYRVYKNNTLLGSSSTISFTDVPTLGDTTAPAAPSAVSASNSNGEITVTWTAPAGFIYNYSVNTVDTSGNAASVNGTLTTGAVVISPASHYLVYRNDTLLGSSSTTAFSDNPGLKGIYVYNVTAVSDANVSSSTNGTAAGVNTQDNTAPAAASAVTAIVGGKEVQLSWTASTSSDVSYYRVYRNFTFIGSPSNQTAFTDNPTLGDNSTPGAPSGVTLSVSALSGQQNISQVVVSWTAPSNSNYVYNITAVDTAGNLAATNGTSGGASIAPILYYQVYRNVTLIGTSSSTSFTDTPPSGIYIYNVTTVSDARVASSANGTSSATDVRDNTAPAAASAVTATIVSNNETHREVSITWTASTSSDVSHYRVYRNVSVIGTSSTTAFTDYPNAGIYIYNITAVDTTNNLASTNGTSGAVTLGESIAPAITITSPAASSNATTDTPTITFTVIENDGGVGIDITNIAVNISGFNATRDCTQHNDLNFTCSYITSSLTDGSNHTLSVAARDKFGNRATNASRSFGVDTRAGVAATLNTSDTSAIADNTYENGWSFTFNITLGSSVANATDVNATAVRVANWTRSGGSETIATAGNTVMNYTDASGTARTYYASHEYNTTDTIYPLRDGSPITQAINGTVTIYVKIPAATVPGTYSTTFTFASYSVALTGGNPS